MLIYAKGALKDMLIGGVYARMKLGEQTVIASDRLVPTSGYSRDSDMNANFCCCPPLQSPCAENADIEFDYLKCLDRVVVLRLEGKKKIL